jgi:lipopolysaccharide/colanic/teichoic acid biosynthesis glycosyltransferase
VSGLAKRALDIAISGPLLVAVTPLLAVLALMVAGDVGRPVLFHQRRSGLQGRTFDLFKFRTMRSQPPGAVLSDEARVTPLGRTLRRYRLDELPQLALVLVGRMSLVGPRPLPDEVLRQCPPELTRIRARCRPGITGWAQVNGNTLLDDHEKLALDVLYGARLGLAFDLRIMVQTLIVLALGERRNEANIEEALRYANSPDRRG